MLYNQLTIFYVNITTDFNYGSDFEVTFVSWIWTPIPVNGLEWFNLATTDGVFSLGKAGGTTSFDSGGCVAHIIAYSTSIILKFCKFSYGSIFSVSEDKNLTQFDFCNVIFHINIEVCYQHKHVLSWFFSVWKFPIECTTSFIGTIEITWQIY